MNQEFQSKHKNLIHILNGLMRRYRERVPAVEKIIQGMLVEGIISNEADIVNDHIAFRTLGGFEGVKAGGGLEKHPGLNALQYLGIDSIARIFEHYGFTRREHYHFPAKKIDAYWFSPPSPVFPRVFISELRIHELSETAQAIIDRYVADVAGVTDVANIAQPEEVQKKVTALNLDNPEEVDTFLHSPLWQLPSYADYTTLLKESEYAAWVIYNRYYLNHYTISVHELKGVGYGVTNQHGKHGNENNNESKNGRQYNRLEEFNAFLEGLGVQLNSAGGKIKVSGDGLLKQSSSVAEMIPAQFKNKDGSIETHDIAGSYVEFAERLVLPEYRDLPEEQITVAHRREGFETSNADKIFESTFTSQTKKR